MTKPTSTTPTRNTLSSEEMVTEMISCAVPSSSAPTTGPYQNAVPPIIGMAMALTAIVSENADCGST